LLLLSSASLLVMSPSSLEVFSTLGQTAGASIPWGNEAEIFMIAILGEIAILGGEN